MLTVPGANEAQSERLSPQDTKKGSTSSQQQQQQQQPYEPLFGHEVPNIKFRDVVLAKKFGSSPYDSDR